MPMGLESSMSEEQLKEMGIKPEEITVEKSEEKKIEKELTPIDKEYKAAQERFSGLINLVNERYENPNSTIAESPEQLKSFEEHNKQILNFCVERGVKKGLGEKQLATLEAAAILHDLAKSGKPPEESANIQNYMLAAHGEIAANEVKSIFEQQPEMLTKILGENYSEEDVEKTISTIEEAIRCHMGPHPGFMTRILENVNKELQKKGEMEIKHPYPEEGNIVAETLLAADMGSLADRKGREKVLTIRLNVPFFRKQDEHLSGECQEFDIDLSPGEAALLSGFDSAEQARDMLEDEDDREWVNELIEESKKGQYTYSEEKINYHDAITKREQFETAKRLSKV
ncbi:HD domain-containing protein [Patescibacteria group bacterium]|nr:HD domain-containing protein [Patescibacteria group bacterium]MBU4512957.1 HD domain-containing protein [Patescibacteria group bacterium]MCG2692993.1 HD domain-containing protein [Candidatus Parcubacteria bacterium]